MPLASAYNANKNSSGTSATNNTSARTSSLRGTTTTNRTTTGVAGGRTGTTTTTSSSSGMGSGVTGTSYSSTSGRPQQQQQQQSKATASSSSSSSALQQRRTSGGGTTALTSQNRPSVGQVLAGLDRGPKSEKGKGIQEDIDNLNDDYFGKPAQTLDQQQGGGRTSAGVLKNQLVAATTSHTPEQLCRSLTVATVQINRWKGGPVDPQGTMLDLSDRNLLCMDVQNNLCVAGSADHGLVLCDIAKKKKLRSLYTKTAGHSEWVTCCRFTPQGRVLSGGMDSKLCLWMANAPRCDDLMGHTGSISDVAVNEHNYAISASYDRTLRVWDLSSRSCQTTLSGHTKPVMNLAWQHSVIVSGDRGGKIHVWDAAVGQSVCALATKGGQIGALSVFSANDFPNLVCAGDQTGSLSVWDFGRTGNVPIFQNVVHPGGVLCDIKQSAPGTGRGLIVTAGADRKINVLEPRQNFQVVTTFSDHQDFIYSLETCGESMILSGGGNGWLLAHDIKTNKCLYGIGASTAAVRAIGFTQDKLCCAGDDGKLAVFDFP